MEESAVGFDFRCDSTNEIEVKRPEYTDSCSCFPLSPSTPVTFNPFRMVQLPPLKDNVKKKSDRNDLSRNLDSPSVSAKVIDSQSDNRWPRVPHRSEEPIPIGTSDSCSVTRGPDPRTLDNCGISIGHLKGKEPELNKSEADMKKEVTRNKMHQALVNSENGNIISNDCVFDPNNSFSTSKIMHTEAEECEFDPLRHSQGFKTKNWRKDLAIKSGPDLDYNVNVNNVVNIEPGNADGDSNLQNKPILDHDLVITIPHALVGLEQSESSICTTADFRMEKNVTAFESTENKITGSPSICITAPRHEPPQNCQGSRPSVQRRSMPPNLSQSFSIIAHKESHGYQVNSKRINSALKAKMCTKMSQDLIISGKSSIQHQTNKIKNSISHSLGLSHENARISSKFQRKHHQEKYHLNQHNQNCPKKVLPCISKFSASSGESITSIPVRQVHSSVSFLDLKYSDMFKEINSNDKGPGIYEMFGTPVYSRKPNEYESRYCRNVYSAPAGRRNAAKHKSSHCKGKNSRMRNVQQIMCPKSHKNPLALKQKQKVLVPKEASELENRCLEQDEGVIVSSTEQQIKTEGNAAPFHEVLDQQLLISTELRQPAKQNEVIPYSNLSPIEEVSLEYTPDVGESFGESSIKKAFTTTVQELLWPEVKVHAEYAPLLGCEKAINEHKNSGKNKSSVQEEPEATTCLMERVNSPLQNLQLGNVSLANLSAKQTCYSADSVSQTYPSIMSYENCEEITEDIFCCSVTELLSLDGADDSCSRAVMKDEDVETQHGNVENNGSTTSVRNSKNFNLNFPESTRENGFLSVTTMAENSLSHEDPVLWTKGEILGKGAYGTVYCGLTNQGHLIAVKQVALNACDQAVNEKEYQKLQEEVEILKNLTHINIVGYLGTSLKDNIVSIFMEFVPGGSVSSIIHRFGPLPETVFCKYTKQILEGVAYLHENRVVHRDIKGNNIMLMPNGVIKLIDFGCAKRLTCRSLTNTHSEPLRSVHGTPYWMAPEIINESGYGRKSDIWSIGCTVFEMATGKPPLASMDRMAAMFYIGAHRGLMPSLPQHCSKTAADFVHLCLTRDQCERPTALHLLQHPFMTKNS
ncbi:mitogen-activated protein kinase kinase kinase 19 [Varanus komodoensis]|uniref:mitogen-activated protein kinase kinase kinase 19 n=1 Tax=Varanus komodoensis TaxID=61221 RepID=UPI001CF7A498|nr:mitogen-activated protein kinase kinase kinase 19 [Varanus komodoensis]